MNIQNASNAMRRFAFHLRRAVSALSPARRISSFGAEDNQISAIIVVNLDRQPGRWRQVRRELSRFRTADGAPLTTIVRRLTAIDARDGRAVAATSDVDTQYRVGDQLYVQPDAKLATCFDVDEPQIDGQRCGARAFLGALPSALNRERLIEFGRKRAQEGAGPATLAIDLSFIRTIITHAAAVHGIEVSAEEARLARVALSHLNLVGKSKERDRRPTQDELDELIEYFETNPRQFIPMGRIVRYAVATTLRQEEICKPEWPLVDMKKRLVVIQDRKDPRNKDGNDQKVPLLNLTGYDAWEVVLQQRIVTRGYGRIFPHNHRSVSAAFTRACDELKIEDLHFHDLRHEGTSRLFEAGLPIEKVALVTGHKDWRQLQRYTNLKVEDLLKLQYAQQPSMEEFVETLAAS